MNKGFNNICHGNHWRLWLITEEEDNRNDQLMAYSVGLTFEQYKELVEMNDGYWQPIDGYISYIFRNYQELIDLIDRLNSLLLMRTLIEGEDKHQWIDFSTHLKKKIIIGV